MHFLGIRILMNRIKVIPYFLKDKTVPVRKKLLVIFGIVYLVSPFDFIPPVFFADDLILWIFIIWHLKDDLDMYWKGDKTCGSVKKIP